MPTMTMTREERARSGGAKLRQMRTQRGWTLADVEKESMRRFGEDYILRETQLSRIEKGSIEKTPFEDAMKIAAIYGLTPTEMAVLFDLWPDTGGDEKRPKEIKQVELLLDTLDEEERGRLLWSIAFVASQARAADRIKKRTGAKTPESQSDWGKYRSVEEDL